VYKRKMWDILVSRKKFSGHGDFLKGDGPRKNGTNWNPGQIPNILETCCVSLTRINSKSIITTYHIEYKG
jgi:hypothetical protein